MGLKLTEADRFNFQDHWIVDFEPLIFWYHEQKILTYHSEAQTSVFF